MRNTSRLDNVLPGPEVPPEIRIGDRLRRARKDEQHENKNEQHLPFWTEIATRIKENQ